MDLKEFFRQHPKAAIAFSGGVDSSYLLYAALQCGADVRAYYVKGAFQPQFELDDAQRLARDIHAPMTVLRADVLRDETVTANPANRCYYCKKVVFSSIAQAALADGYTLLLDGTNASDDAGDRPGMRALQELQVLSPLLYAYPLVGLLLWVGIIGWFLYRNKKQREAFYKAQQQQQDYYQQQQQQDSNSSQTQSRPHVDEKDVIDAEYTEREIK